MDQLRAITTFIRAAQSGSISGAARALGLTPQAASKHILNLEQWAGVRLLNRNTHKISLTEEGIAFYERCKPAVESIEEGLIGLRDVSKDPVGTVRLAVPHGIVQLVGPLMGRFLDCAQPESGCCARAHRRGHSGWETAGQFAGSAQVRLNTVGAMCDSRLSEEIRHS